MSELFPLLLERTGGTPGSGDATGRVRRMTAAQRADFLTAIFGAMPPQSVWGRNSSGPEAILLPSSTVFGRAATGGVRPLTAADLDALLGLSALIAGRAPLIHGHAIADVTGLQALLDTKAPLNHTHLPSQVRANGVTNGWVLTANGDVAGWAAPPSGGGGGAISPLTANLDIATFALMSGATELFRFSGGRVFVQGAKIPILNENTGALVDGHVWVKRPGAWVHALLKSTEVAAEAISGLPGATVYEMLLNLYGLVQARALLSHTHALNDITVPGGAVPGHYVTPKAGGGWEVIALPSAGGGVTNPLTADLNIAGFKVVSGATEIIRVSGGNILLGGRVVFPSTITSPAAKHVPVYDTTNNDFRNRQLTAADIAVSAIGGLSGADVQAALAWLESTKLETTATTDAVAEGASATRKYATSSSVAAAGAVMVSSISDNEALGTSTTTVVSQRAIKVYVDTAVAGGGGSGLAKGTSFPGSPADGDLFYRTDLRELFIRSASPAAWIGEERWYTIPVTRLAAGTGTGGGAYVFGSGNTYGFRLPVDAYLTGATLHQVNVDSGSYFIRKANEGGATSDAFSVTVAAARGGSSAAQLHSINAGQLVSVYAASFTSGVDFFTATLTYRRRL